MVGKNNVDYSSVPTSVELENNSNQSKYTVNRAPKGSCIISKLVAALFIIGVLILLALAIGLTYLLVPKCSDTAPEALTGNGYPQKQIDVQKLRLPRAIQPSHYRLQIMPSFEDNFTTTGAVTIRVNVAESTDQIVFNLKDIEVDKDSVKVKEATANETDKSMAIKEQYYDDDYETYTVTLEENVEEGHTYDLEMNFMGHLSNDMKGFYKSFYRDSANNTKWMAVTQFSPTYARRAFPCFDEPSFKAKYSISVGRPSNMTSISNMPKTKSDMSVERSGWVWDHYEETPLMSSYLVAFIVSDLQPLLKDNIFTLWAHTTLPEQIRYASEIGPKMLQYFESYFGTTFALPKIDMVAIPDMSFSAMENWGLITFRDDILLWDDKVSTVNDKRTTAAIIGHELAHQWFGNLATPRWWNDLWLKEGFATYLQYFGVNHVEPSWNVMDEILPEEMHKAFQTDALRSSHPISTEVYNDKDIQQMFDKISYYKGASVVRMMSHFLGDQTFKSGLIKFLKQYKYSNADHNELWDIFTAQAIEDGSLPDNVKVKNVMDSWTLQPGFPVVTAVRNRNTSEVHVSQKRYLLTQGENDYSVWWVPISYTSDASVNFDDTKPKAWLRNEHETSFKLEADRWWLLNLKQTGYYIVNYDEENWNSLAQNIMYFSPIIRAQLISDAMDLARINALDYDKPLRMLTAIGTQDREITFLPLLIAFDKIEYVYNTLATTPAFGKFDVWLSSVFSYAYKSVGFDDSRLDTYLAQRIRRIVLKWACKRSDSICVNLAINLYRTVMANKNRQPMQTNIKEVVYCTAIREGGEREWNFAYRQYLSSQIASEKKILLNALGCASKPWLLSRYLEYMLKNDSSIRKQDGPRVFAAVAKNIGGHLLAFDFLRTRWKEIIDYYGDSHSILSSLVEQLPIYMNSNFHLSQLKNFQKENWNSLGSATQALNRSIELVTANVEWMKHSYGSLEKWVKSNNDHYGLRK